MSYCRATKTCRVYMYHHVLGGYQFHVLGTAANPDADRQDFRIMDPKEALHRLKRLQTQGFGVPQHAVDRLAAEIKESETRE